MKKEVSEMPWTINTKAVVTPDPKTSASIAEKLKREVRGIAPVGKKAITKTTMSRRRHNPKQRMKNSYRMRDRK